MVKMHLPFSPMTFSHFRISVPREIGYKNENLTLQWN